MHGIIIVVDAGKSSSEQFVNSTNFLVNLLSEFNMAAKFPTDSGIKLQPRKGHDMTWSCDKHAEPISFYCEDHNIPLCHKCAFKNHQRPCQVQDIEDVILEKRTKLDDKQLELDEMLKRCKRLNSKIQSCSTFVSNHLETVNAEVNIAYEGKFKCVETKKQENILQINKEVDEKIQILNEERERRIASCIAEAENEEQTIKETKAKRLTESKNIDTTVGKKMENLKSKIQHSIDTITNVDLKIERIRQNDRTLVNEVPPVMTTLDESVFVVHQDIDACLARIKDEVERVKFVEGEIGGKQFGRIDGFNGTWKLAKSFPLPSTLKYPVVCGLISDDELCVRDLENNDLYVSNISNGHTNKVIKGDSDMFVTSCAPIENDLIVCGKWRNDSKGDSLDRCITINDRQWKVVRDITIPRNRSCNDEVSIDVDKDGMILAAQHDQSNIYVINPADCKIVHTITIQGEWVDGEIQALSSGDIVLHTDENEFTVISRSGEKISTIQHDECYARCQVDKLTDTLYITYWIKERDIYTGDQMSHDGDIQARSIVEYRGIHSQCAITPSGNLIACDGGNISVYKKLFLI